MRLARAGVFLVAGLCCAGAFAGIEAGQYLQDVRVLASPGMRGRADGSPELNRAAEYIAAQFRSFHLQPVRGDSYFQDFEIAVQTRRGRNNHLTVRGVRGINPLHIEQDYLPLSISASGEVTAGLVFAGYGITAPEYGYDDYAGVSAQGKVVLVLRHEPQEFDDRSVFAGRVYTGHSQLINKVLNAQQHGASAVLVANDIGSHGNGSDVLEPFGTAEGPAGAAIPCLEITAEVADQLLRSSETTVRDLQAELDREPSPHSFALPDSIQASIRTDVERVSRTVHNVAGYLPGETPEYIVIGAHYDHLGLGEQFSLAPLKAGTIHPGADDNASGTAGVVELARCLSERGRRGRRGILFLAFAGEELGLLGSLYWTNHPTLPLKDAAAMINMDMIGRIQGGRVSVGGIGTGAGLRGLFAELPVPEGISLDVSDQMVYGSSDHSSFLSKEIPYLFFFSGLHADYHTPGDTWEKINAGQAARLLDYVAAIAAALCDAGDRPRFLPPKRR